MKTLAQLIHESWRLLHSGKSVNIKAALKVIAANTGMSAVYEERTGYKGTQRAGDLYVTRRKIVKYYKVTISEGSKVVFTVDSEINLYCAYTMTNWIINFFKN